MVDSLIEILETLDYPVYRQGSMSNDESYPETFITFWNSESPDHSHYDNTDYGTEWVFNVYVYSADPEITYSALADIRTALKGAGWVVPSSGYDVQSDIKTHTGRGLEVAYLEIEED